MRSVSFPPGAAYTCLTGQSQRRFTQNAKFGELGVVFIDGERPSLPFSALISLWGSEIYHYPISKLAQRSRPWELATPRVWFFRPFAHTNTFKSGAQALHRRVLLLDDRPRVWPLRSTVAGRAGYAPASDDHGVQHSIWRSAENAERGVRVYYWGVVGVASASWATPP